MTKTINALELIQGILIALTVGLCAATFVASWVG